MSGMKLIACVLFWIVAASATAAEGYLDMHVHTAGIGAGDSGAFVGAAMRGNLRFRLYLRAFAVTEEELEAEGDGLVIRKISAKVAESEQVARAVILAMDGVVADGELDREATQYYVPNDFVAAEVKRYDNLCYGASVNPQRHDALARLEQAHKDGALLVKWIPNVMHFDPADPAIEPFYRKLIELDLPLLSHAGKEQAFADARDDLGDPRRLAFPLALGVTVIAAHIATTGKSEGEDNFERILPMFDEYPNLYSEISSLTQINKRNYLKRALDVPGLDRRLLYGTDYPLQFFPLVSSAWHLRHIGAGAARRVGSIRNQWDRDVALKRAIGTPEHVFARSAELLDVERCVLRANSH